MKIATEYRGILWPRCPQAQQIPDAPSGATVVPVDAPHERGRSCRTCRREPHDRPGLAREGEEGMTWREAIRRQLTPHGLTRWGLFVIIIVLVVPVWDWRMAGIVAACVAYGAIGVGQ